MDRCLGTMLGLAIGDALGAPVEGLKAGHIQQLIGQVENYLDPFILFPDRPGKWRRAALYTDDTQQALALADTLAIYSEADTQHLAELYVRLWREGANEWPFGGHRGTGHFFRRAVERMEECPENPALAGQPSAGNGAAMRIAPLGLWRAAETERLSREVIQVSRLTHSDPRGIGAALALAWIVAWFAEEKGSPEAAAAEMLPWLAGQEEELRENWGLREEGLEERPRSLAEAWKGLPLLVKEKNADLAQRSILEAAAQCGPSHRLSQPSSGFAPASVYYALYVALSADNFTKGLLEAVNSGGDADTVGAMTGAVLGARFGVEDIPEGWIEGLMNTEQVQARGRALRDREVDWAAWEDYIEMEKDLTRLEWEAIQKEMAEKRRLLQKEKEKREEKKARAQEKKKGQKVELLPPLDIWFGNKPPLDGHDEDPEEQRRHKEKRGKKRIPWKEERRQKKRKKGHEEEE